MNFLIAVAQAAVAPEQPIYLQHPELLSAAVMVGKWIATAVMLGASGIATVLWWAGTRYIDRMEEREQKVDGKLESLKSGIDEIHHVMLHCDGCRASLDSLPGGRRHYDPPEPGIPSL